MKRSLRYSLVGIGALACLSLVHWGRGAGHCVSDSCQNLLGVLPNFTAAIAIPFVMLNIWADQNPHGTHAAARRSFLFLTLVAGTSLVAWEFMQMGGRTLVHEPATSLRRSSASAWAVFSSRS